MIDSLYYGTGCSCCSPSVSSVAEFSLMGELEGAVGFDMKVLDIFRHALYNGLDPDRDIEPAMWTEILRIMNEAAVEGISASRTGYNPHDEDFYRALRHSNEVFSTFKVHNFQQEMAAKLFDGKRLRSFDEWTKATMGIASHQVGSWLETEYNTAVIRAHQAADWQEFVRNKDILPNLRWMPTTSPEPDDKHKHYWMSRLTLPVDDPFWNEHYPGDRWNCKCSLEATDDPVNRPKDIPEDKPQRGLDTNAGKTGEMFSQSHPYFPKDCAHCFARANSRGTTVGSIKNRLLTFFNAGGKKDCFNCPFLAKRPGYKPDAVYGYRLLVSNQADQTEVKENVRCAKSLLKSFPDMHVEVRPHVIADNVKNPEYKINGLIGDRKGIESEKGVTSAFQKAIKQGCSVVILDLDMHKDNFKKLRTQKMAGKIASRSSDFASNIVRHCYVVYKGKAVKIGKDCFSKDRRKNIDAIKTVLDELTK